MAQAHMKDLLVACILGSIVFGVATEFHWPYWIGMPISFMIGVMYGYFEEDFSGKRADTARNSAVKSNSAPESGDHRAGGK